MSDEDPIEGIQERAFGFRGNVITSAKFAQAMPMSDDVRMDEADIQSKVDAKIATAQLERAVEGADLRADFAALRADMATGRAAAQTVAESMRTDFLKMETSVDKLLASSSKEVSSLRADMHKGFADQTKWFFASIMSTIAAALGIAGFVAAHTVAPATTTAPAPAAPAAAPLVIQIPYPQQATPLPQKLPQRP